jgi:hypothetical protein
MTFLRKNISAFMAHTEHQNLKNHFQISFYTKYSDHSKGPKRLVPTIQKPSPHFMLENTGTEERDNLFLFTVKA